MQDLIFRIWADVLSFGITSINTHICAHRHSISCEHERVSTQIHAVSSIINTHSIFSNITALVKIHTYKIRVCAINLGKINFNQD